MRYSQDELIAGELAEFEETGIDRETAQRRARAIIAHDMNNEEFYLCANHCKHSPDWMRYDEDFEVRRCAHPIGYACDDCGGLECGHQCKQEPLP